MLPSLLWAHLKILVQNLLMRKKARKKRVAIKQVSACSENPEDEVLGGVCSGIAAYFGIADPLWVRLAFIVFTISGGFGIPLYVILWAVLPKASSSSDRLAMRGEPINVSNISKIIEEEFTNLSTKVSELGEELAGKKKLFQKQKVKEKMPLEKELV